MAFLGRTRMLSECHIGMPVPHAVRSVGCIKARGCILHSRLYAPPFFAPAA